MDLTLNVVVFQLNSNDKDLITAAAPAQAHDSVRQAWQQAKGQRHFQPSDVTRVHSTWQPADADRDFLAATFPEAEHSHLFERPEGDDWTDALEYAKRVMDEVENIKLRQRSEETFAQAERVGEWLPILHSAAEPLPFSASLPLVEGKLYFGFARVTTTPEGRIGMSHLTRSKFDAMSIEAIEELALEALGNVKSGLNFKVAPDEQLGTLATLERDGPCVASAILLDDFHEKCAEQVGADRLVVGLISPDHILIAGADSGQVEHIRQAVLTSPDTGTELVPSLLLIDADTIEVIAERPR
ncbi:hypothetical protein ACIA8C_10800 [Nocardia sp. NPDC051321]|uniref:hypothetical protein n=1 Tax=Nocardia sp. NPDC051321 TaxID=3364323 RepID=UPI0037A5534D